MTTKTITRVNITIDEELRYILDTMKESYPTLTYSELIRMATGGYFVSKKDQFTTTKISKKDISEWIKTLPSMKLTKKQEQDLQNSIQESAKSTTKNYSSVDLMMQDIMEEKI